MLLKAKTNIRYGGAAHEFIASGATADIQDEALAKDILKSGAAERVRGADKIKPEAPKPDASREEAIAKIAAALKDFGVAEDVTGLLALDIYGVAHGVLSEISVTPPPPAGITPETDAPPAAAETPAADSKPGRKK